MVYFVLLKKKKKLEIIKNPYDTVIFISRVTALNALFPANIAWALNTPVEVSLISMLAIPDSSVNPV